MWTPRAPLGEMITAARPHLTPDWNEDRHAAALRGVYRRRRRRRWARAMAGTALAVLVGMLVHRSLPRPDGPRPAVATAPARPVLILPDEAVAEPMAGAEVRLVEGPQGRRALSVRRGGVRVRTADRAGVQRFHVEVAGIAIDISGSGAVFLVEETTQGPRVAAEQGTLRIMWNGQEAELGPGRGLLLAASPPPREPAAPAEKPPAQPSWRALAREGQFERAYGALRQDRAALDLDQPGDLLLAADVARLSRHPQQAVAPLERLLRRHPRDPRAPLAAFTLGRILLDDLGRPQEAAAAFARSRQLDPAGTAGPMAEDALAREVEAWSRAGEMERARERAEEYRRLYPEGRRLRSVLRFGGLD